MNGILVSTTFIVDGYRVSQYKGIARGVAVRSTMYGQGIMDGLKTMISGQMITFLREMCDQARQQAYDTMLSHAVQLGANAVLGFRYDASEVAQNTTEVLCYGTAAIIEPVR